MSRNSEKVKRYRQRHKHPCIDCGNLCDHRVLRCKACAGVYHWANRHISLGLPVKKHCLKCGKHISHKSKRCRDCAKEFNIARNKANCGDKSPSWKGGRYTVKDGYAYILKPEHPRAVTGKQKGYVAEHILIWEESSGKPLPQGWVIHHLNGIKDDNRPSNLVAFPNKKHYLILQAKAKRIQELEALLNNQHQLL